MSSGSQSPNPLLVIICYINPFYQKTQGKDTAQVFRSGSKQAAAVRGWVTGRGRCGRELSKKAKVMQWHIHSTAWNSTGCCHCPSQLISRQQLQQKLIGFWHVCNLLLTSSPSFPSRQQSETGYFGSGQILSLSFTYLNHVACYFKRRENGNLSNKLLPS